MNDNLRDVLFREILHARQRVYEVAQPTPLQEIALPIDAQVFIKREDLSPINSYKWRGAYYRMTKLTPEERARGVICASAGNHAQGVALAANRMGLSAKIVMPTSTPRMKLESVRLHGGPMVETILHGDTFDAAAARAREIEKEEDRVFIHPYDDLAVMAGQGTLADEIVMSGKGPFDIAYVQIGGGGMAAAVACWLKYYWPGIRIVGVEGVDQASMAAAVRERGPVSLDYVDVFADGTAVKRAGDLTYPLCASLIDEFVLVTNEELCAATQLLWESSRCIPEPSGAMGLAGLMKQQDRVKGKRVLTILCGANMDFSQLAWISRHAGIGAKRRRYFRFHTEERRGSLLELIETFLEGINIIEFQFGKVHETRAFPVLGIEASPMELELMVRRLTEHGVRFDDVTSAEDVEFRLIHFNPATFHYPWFLKLEFPERPGALRDFLRAAGSLGSLCYFNYAHTGERVGRALLGFEFTSEDVRAQFQEFLRESHWQWSEMPENVVKRLLSSGAE